MQQQKSFNQRESSTVGTLYLVPTPIGNLEDMTYRAVSVLDLVDLILAEDTRHTIKLLNHFNLDTRMKSFHEHSHSQEVESMINLLLSGQNLALVSDAGMPLINDPGHPLVEVALQQEVPVVALPGANAAMTALIASGLSAKTFTYYGFFPRDSKEQEALLEQIGSRNETALLYESPFRIKQAVKSVAQVLHESTRIVIARELTKRYEEYLRGTAGELGAYLSDNNLKGEIVLLIEGGSLIAEQKAQVEQLPYKEHVELLMSSQGMISKEAIKQVASIRQVKKQEVYNAYHEINK